MGSDPFAQSIPIGRVLTLELILKYERIFNGRISAEFSTIPEQKFILPEL